MAWQQLEILSALADHLDAMIAFWDRNQVCGFCNDAYRHWFGKSKDQIVGKTLRELLGPELYAKNLPHIQAAYAGQRQVFERDIPTPDGTIRHSLATYIPHVVDGEVQGIFVHVADVGPLKRLESELRAAKDDAVRLATHDVLTGLPNRVLLMDRIERDMALSRREGQVLAVLSLDVDDFKKVNDTFGHLAGDRLLIAIARRLESTLRASDSVTRIGGDEFILLAPGVTSADEVESIVERVRIELEQPVDVGAASITPRLSIGVALFPRDGTTPEALLAGSDRALYAAKALGKGRHAYALTGEFEPKNTVRSLPW